MSGLNITAERARDVADAIDAYDQQIKDLQDGKRETFASLRTDLEDLGLDRANIREELAALKAAIAKRAKRREDADAVDERDAMTDSYLDLIERSAPRATPARTREERSKDRLSEAMSDNKEMSAEMLRDGLISPEAHAENVALSDAVAAKLGSGVVPEKPSGAGTGSAVRAGAPVSKIATPDRHPAAQSEAAAGERPEQGADESASGDGAAIAAQSASFVTPTGEGEGAAPSVDPSSAADRPKFVRKEHVLRPHCQRPELCGSYGSKHCAECERAAKASGDDEDGAVVPAFIRKTHDHAIGEQA